MNVFVVDSDLKRMAQLAFSLSKACITATPLDPSDRIDLPAQEPCLFLVCDLDETRALQRRIPARSCLICYADGVELRNVVAAMKLGAREYFSWPDDVDELIARARDGHVDEEEKLELQALIRDLGRAPREQGQEGGR